MQNIRLLQFSWGGIMAVALSCLSSPLAAQAAAPPPHWHLLDAEQDGVMGISAERAYRELLAGKRPLRKVRVAVLDSGFDTAHTDLRDHLYRAPGERPANGQDDDHNGHIDDVSGWNFLGSANGRMVHYETLELTREYKRLMAAFDTPEKAPTDQRAYFAEVKKAYLKALAKAKTQLEEFEGVVKVINECRQVMRAALGEPLTTSRIEPYAPKNEQEQRAQRVMLIALEQGLDSLSNQTQLAELNGRATFNFDLTDTLRRAVDDHVAHTAERRYGNANLGGPHQDHGTHVAGIIGARRDGKTLADERDGRGVADAVEIICVRVVPLGDERDKDIANGIRYAVDRGAQIINMSFGKDYSPQKAVVDSAVQYAVSRGVLLVHGAGNDSRNIDRGHNFPSARYLSGAVAETWLEVGSSTWKPESFSRVSSFSNYGVGTVDLLAPGSDILNLNPGGGTAKHSGTSMASPVAAGVAAVVWAYYPTLTATELKTILLESVTPLGDEQVAVPQDEESESDADAQEGGDHNGKAGAKKYKPLKEIVRSAGVINLYRALQAAERRVAKPSK